MTYKTYPIPERRKLPFKHIFPPARQIVPTTPQSASSGQGNSLKRTRYSAEAQAKVLELYNAGKSRKEASVLAGVKIETARRWISEHIEAIAVAKAVQS